MFRFTSLTGLVWAGAGQAFASTEAWQVNHVSGQAWITDAQTGRAVIEAGMEIEAGVTITTGDRSRVMLVHGGDTMMVGPRSIVAVSPHPTEGLSTTILQKTGAVSYDVEHQDGPHFSVETPMMAAVVKGTQFVVTVNRSVGDVAVTRGTVGVTALATGQRSDVTAGQRANVNHGGLSVAGGARRASITRSAPEAAIVAAVSVVSPLGAFTSAELSASATYGGPPTAGSATASQAQGSPASNAASARNSGAVSTTGAGTAPVANTKAPSVAAPTASAPAAPATQTTSTSTAGVSANPGPAASAAPSSTPAAAAPGQTTAPASAGPIGQGDGTNPGGTNPSGSSGDGKGGHHHRGGDHGHAGRDGPNFGQSGAGKSDNGKGNGGSPGNGRGHSN